MGIFLLSSFWIYLLYLQKHFCIQGRGSDDLHELTHIGNFHMQFVRFVQSWDNDFKQKQEYLDSVDLHQDMSK